jgi:hypothetical protein
MCLQFGIQVQFVLGWRHEQELTAAIPEDALTARAFRIAKVRLQGPEELEAMLQFADPILGPQMLREPLGQEYFIL